MRRLGWGQVFRLGLVQMAIGSIVVLTTSTLNRVMVVELSLPAMLPGALVGLYYVLQLTRPNWGFRSDAGGARTPWILGGVVLLALGAMTATLAVALLPARPGAGIALAATGFVAIGFGAGAASTSLLALLAVAVAPARRAAAATIVWLMMILGTALTATGVGATLDPYSPRRLVEVVAVVLVAAVAAATVALAGIERGLGVGAAERERTPFRVALAQVWAEPRARAFTLLIALSMTAYFMQELILEPFAGHVFGFTPGQSTAMAGLQNGGVFVGMLAVGAAVSGFGIGSLRAWTAAGCLGSAAALAAIAAAGLAGPGAPLRVAVAGLGVANGVFAVAAVGAMMQLAGEGRAGREGTRMGLWGAAQALAAGFGGFVGAAAADVARRLTGSPAEAYGAVFLAEAALFVLAAGLALRVIDARPRQDRLRGAAAIVEDGGAGPSPARGGESP
ncbi:BCD family MFS transporter [Amaricoccus sp.]|uniref:BCD family MFS transporter n=1 Tax=Amaricoccus sp. TaxID=1872485 RepID=UPI001B512A9F|nr:BCD family MFS transporter [Amaricoccus sp.]MBP7002442.1 BCD family MFS transporter [Amaricoccus sp.]